MRPDEALRSAQICRKAYSDAMEIGAPGYLLEMLHQCAVWFELRAYGVTMREVARS